MGKTNETTSPLPPGNTRLVVVALVLAVLSVVLTNFYISSVRKQNQLDSFRVYILQIPRAAGDKIRRKDVRAVRVPDTPTFREAFDQIGAIDQTGLDIRMTQKEPLKRNASSGQILMFRHFTSEDRQAIDQKIARGKRLKVLSINSRTVPGALRVGMFVDLEAAFGSQRGLVVLPVMERVKVIALGNTTAYDTAGRSRRQSRYNSITIEVTPRQATQLNQIERTMTGDFDLAVRNPGDTALIKIPSGGINSKVLDLIDLRMRK